MGLVQLNGKDEVLHLMVSPAPYHPRW